VVAGDDSLIEAVLSAAGRSTLAWSATRVGTETSTNRTYAVSVEGQTFIARCYRWPYGGVDELNRPRKEAWLSRMLAAAGVPVAEVVATVDDEAGHAAALMTYVECDLLGDLAAPRAPDLDGAWEHAGAALRRAHDLDGPPGGAGVIVGDRVRPFDEGNWGAWQAANLRDHSDRLARRHGETIPLHALHELADAAEEALSSAPIRLLHNDPHAWNVVVARHRGGWRCAAWLDWEFAWVGDPTWDLARLDVFRMADIGATPDAFYLGYGSRPMSPAYELYVLSINLWMVNQSDDGDDTLPVTYAAARDYVKDLNVHIGRLHRLLER
jgi:aminoglycoside phosphotransferase (APT) family kinase protein